MIFGSGVTPDPSTLSLGQGFMERRRSLRLFALVGALALLPRPAQAQMMSWVATVASLKGDDRCLAGSRDCNPCVESVEAQFASLFVWGGAPVTRSWGYDPELPYPPHGETPSYLFSGGDHVQGFARTYNENFPFAGTYSQRVYNPPRLGSVFLLGATDVSPTLGYYELTDLFEVENSRHPSGLSVLGQHLVFTDGTDTLRLVDLEGDPIDSPKEVHIDGLKTGGGGLALVKAHAGGYYLITSDNIDAGAVPQQPGVRFYYLAGELEDLHGVTPLGAWESPTGPTYERENLSLLTECGTGDVFAIHSSTSNLEDTYGHFRLWKFEMVPSGLTLQEVDVSYESSNLLSCDFRSAATAFATKDHELRAYCHARDAGDEVCFEQTCTSFGEFL